MSNISDQIKNNSMPLLVLVVIVGAFVIGRLSSQVETLKAGSNTPAAVVTQDGQTAAPVVTIDQIKNLFGDKQAIKFGDAKKKVLFVEVSDPSCPYCHAAAGKNPELSKEMGPQFTLVSDGGSYVAPVVEMKKLVDEDKAAFIWIYSNGHGNGVLASQALYCANEKGKYWEAHDLLYSNAGYTMINETVKNDVAKSAQLAAFLKSAVDEKFMADCLSTGKYADRLKSDEAVAASIGVQGTPGFYVNETNYPGAVSFDDMKSVVDAAL